MEYLYVGVGGIFGALTRYALSKWVGQRSLNNFPIATFCINLSGSFLLGFLYIFFSKHTNLESARYITTTGLLGAYTTYSTFTFEIVNLVEQGSKGKALKYFSLSVILGILAAFLGMISAQNI